jgi:N-acetylglucosaminyl-diphospho-decaprenol L-rhamnosyltransferase
MSHIAKVTISVVSHGHGQMVWELVEKLSYSDSVAQIIVTLNINELVPWKLPNSVTVVKNNSPRGFGENHNEAFKMCRTEFFGVINPDIDFIEDPFPVLLDTFIDKHVGLVGPIVVGPTGLLEDSIRKFPTPLNMIERYLIPWKRKIFVKNKRVIFPEWIAGMFMIFNAKVFREVQGFDVGYFMYCEDADICTRLWRHGRYVVVNQGVTVIHNAQRASRKSPLHLSWHISSLLRYGFLYTGRLPKISSKISREKL